MDPLNALLTRMGDLLLAPFQGRPATGLVCWSVVTGVLMTYVFGKTSNQRGLRKAADNIRAQLFAVKLFKEDLFVTFQCQIALLKSTAMRILHSIPPMLVMFVPLLLVLTQLAMRYEFRPLVAGDRAVVAMHVNPSHWKQRRDIQLADGERFVVETDALRDERSSTVLWRVRAVGNESEPLRWQIDNDTTISKDLPLAANHDLLRVSNPTRPGASWWDRVLYPAEPSLPIELGIESIEIQLAPRSTPVFGWDLPWWATFFLISMVVAFITGKIIGVQY